MTWKRLMARNTGACGGLGVYRGEAKGREFFSILAFFNHYSRNEPAKVFFPNLALLSHVNPSGVTYEVVAPVHLARLEGLVCSRVATLAGVVPRRISRVS
jgi:hypothetical protein